MLEGQRRRGRQLSPEKVRRGHRPFILVRSQTNPLTASLPRLRSDLLAIVSAGIEGASASGLLSRALGRAGALPDGDFRVIAAGKAATSMAATLDRICGSRIRAGLVIGAP